MPDEPNKSHFDLSKLLDDWQYIPGQLNVRQIEGDDGEARIQIRLDLGILQLHTSGRPDGQRPQGYISYLDYCEARVDAEQLGDDAPAVQIEAPDEQAEDPFVLGEEDCRILREEAAQYYHRYMALLLLEDFDGVVRDTTRNLRVLDLCSRFAQTDHDRQVLDPYRPYILMIRSRALAGQAIKDGEPKAALLAIDQGLDALKGYFSHLGRADEFEHSNEVQMLRSMRDSLVPKLPVSQRAELKQRIQSAIETENFELAAILRDELRMMGEAGAV